MKHAELINEALKFHKSFELDKAENIYKEILCEDPNCFDALQLYACLLHSKKNFNSAIEMFERAIKTNSVSSPLFNNYGNLNFELKKWHDAKFYYEKSISLDPTNAFAYNNLGTIHKELYEFEKSMECFNKALELAPDYADAHWNRSILNLLLNNFKEGWQEFEWRWSSPSVSKMAGVKKYLSKPYTGIQPLRDKKILVYHEQGLGDSIQFFRFVIALSECCDCVIVHVPNALLGIFSAVSDRIIPISLDNDPGSVDYNCAMLSLPLLLHYDNGNVPFSSGYLYPKLEYLNKWNNKIILNSNRLNVGIVWSGNAGHTNDLYRSIDFASVRRFVTNNPNVNFISLQKEYRFGELEQILDIDNLTDISCSLLDFDDTLAVSSMLDYVISVDTSVIHLVAASGKKASIILPMVPDWRWGLNSNKTNWYDSLTVHRCTKINEWEDVFNELSILIGQINKL